MSDDQEQFDVSSMFHEQLLERCRALEDRLKDIEAELEHSHRLAMLGTIVGSIAHEINNILTPVVSYAELARMHPEDAELAAKALDRAASGASRAASIAASILDLVRSTSEEIEIPSADIASAVEHTLLCTGQRDSGCVTVEVEPGCAAAIEPIALQQVLLNLMLNASRALERKKSGGVSESSGVAGSAGQLTVRGSTWNTPTGEHWVRIEVEDTGCGMDAQTLGRVFEPFVSHAGASDAGRVGTGLGLSTSRQLIERFKGTIAAKSQVGVGTVFTIELPASRGAQSRKSA